MRVGIARAQQDRHARQAARVTKRRASVGPISPPGKGDQRTVACRAARGVTRLPGMRPCDEADQGDALAPSIPRRGIAATHIPPLSSSAELSQGSFSLITREERVRVPGVLRRTRCDQRRMLIAPAGGPAPGCLPLTRRVHAAGSAQTLLLTEGRPREARSAALREDHSAASAVFSTWSSIFGSVASTTARRGSSHGGSFSASPRCSTVSSNVKPGGSVAISKSTPPGSRK